MVVRDRAGLVAWGGARAMIRIRLQTRGLEVEVQGKGVGESSSKLGPELGHIKAHSISWLDVN